MLLFFLVTVAACVQGSPCILSGGSTVDSSSQCDDCTLIDSHVGNGSSCRSSTLTTTTLHSTQVASSAMTNSTLSGCDVTVATLITTTLHNTLVTRSTINNSQVAGCIVDLATLATCNFSGRNIRSTTCTQNVCTVESRYSQALSGASIA